MKNPIDTCLIGCALGVLIFITGCSTLTAIKNAVVNTEHAATGSNAVLTCKIVGAIVDTTMTDAAIAYHNKEITADQWGILANLHDTKFLPIYNAEVANIAVAQNPASVTLQGVMSQLVSTYQSFTHK